jgi:NADH:ubiquinone oxidoreductase subunit 4 (subunit M)
MLWMFQRVYYGPVTDSHNADMADLKPHEWAGIAPLCAMALFMGVAPTLFLKPMEPSVARIVERIQGARTYVWRIEFAIQNSKCRSHALICSLGAIFVPSAS